MDPKTATKLEETELLKLQNIALRLQVLDGERQAFGLVLHQKYATSGQPLTIEDDGTIKRGDEAGGHPRSHLQEQAKRAAEKTKKK